MVSLFFGSTDSFGQVRHYAMRGCGHTGVCLYFYPSASRTSSPRADCWSCTISVVTARKVDVARPCRRTGYEEHNTHKQVRIVSYLVKLCALSLVYNSGYYNSMVQLISATIWLFSQVRHQHSQDFYQKYLRHVYMISQISPHVISFFMFSCRR